MASRSPSVRLLERDLSTYTVTESNTILAIVGYASYGPIMSPQTTTSLKEFQDSFGEGATNAPWSYLGAYRAFNQTNNVVFMRVADETLAAEAEKNVRTFERGRPGSVTYDTNQFVSLDVATQADKYFSFTVGGKDAYFTTPNTASVTTDELVSRMNTAAGETVGFSIIGDSYTSLSSSSGLTAGTTYAFDITVDSGSPTTISFSSSGTTISDLISDLQTALFGLDVLVAYDSAAEGIKISSTLSTGTGSALLLETPTTGDDIFSTLTSATLYEVDGRDAIVGVTFENVSGDLKVSLAGSNLTSIDNNTPILGASVEDDVNGFLDLATATTLTYVPAGSQDDGYVINFKALYPGTYGKNIQVQKSSIINDFDGSTSHNIEILFKGDVVETFSGVSLDSEEENYFVSLINETKENGGSQLVSVEVTDPTTPPSTTVVPFTDGLYTLGSKDFSYEVSYKTDSSDYDYRVGNDGIPEDAESERVLFLEALSTGADSPMMNTESYDYHILITPDTQDSVIQDAALTLANAEGRKDFIYIVDPPMGLKYNEVKDWHNGKYPGRVAALNSSYGALYWSWQKDVNPTDGRIVDVPPSVFMAEKYLEVDNTFGPWYPPAGDVRGRLVSQGYEASPSFAQREQLYGDFNAINPIVNFSSKGLLVYGQKTLLRDNSALNRVNVRRMVIFIKKLIKRAMDSMLFEPHNPDSWRRATNSITSILEPIRQRNGIDQYSVTIDGSTNTPDLIAQSIMSGIIKIVPVGTIEIIELTLQVNRAGSSLEE